MKCLYYHSIMNLLNRFYLEKDYNHKSNIRYDMWRRNNDCEIKNEFPLL